jgi:hypothetical protein
MRKPLRRAKAMGYFNKAARISQLKTDKNLISLRSCEDYKKLLAECEDSQNAIPHRLSWGGR